MVCVFNTLGHHPPFKRWGLREPQRRTTHYRCYIPIYLYIYFCEMKRELNQ
eukprot:gene982-577_t